MDRTLSDYFCCPEEFTKLEAGSPLSKHSGFFEFGQGVTCYGQFAGGTPPKEVSDGLPDTLELVRIEGDRVILPFDLAQVVANLRCERYLKNSSGGANGSHKGNVSRRLYYLLRPILPVGVRKHLQRMRLKGWDDIPFPRWPVDFTVESLMEQALAMVLRSGQVSRIPFIWFWPYGVRSGTIMTHDVEAAAGLNFVPNLMDLDDSFGIKSAFQVVPEVRYDTSKDFIDSVRARGFEVNVHDLNHDGSLYLEKTEFLRRAVLINRYATKFETAGFRAGAMYRNQDWYDAFDFSYDMSVPNVAHLEPQRGGCCTVMPYFIGKLLELPLTTIQDYSLFHILGDYSIDLWKVQIDLILKRNGLISFIVHPDYVIDQRAQQVYTSLLGHLVQLRKDQQIWITLPSQVNQWWRDRSQMNLVRASDGWKIEGPGSERARVAYATLEAGRLVYKIPGPS
jgi:hypothetical protein